MGKSALVHTYTERSFNEKLLSTLGAEMGKREIYLDGGQLVKLEIWDTAGQETFFSLTRQYYRNADGCFVVFDLTNKNSFDDVPIWVNKAKENCNNDNICIMMLGNKTDMADRRAVRTEEALARAGRLGVPYAELTARSTGAVDEVFAALSEMALGVITNSLDESSSNSNNPRKRRQNSIKLRSTASRQNVLLEAEEQDRSRFSKCCSSI